jgi:hypothetical protein
MGSVLSVVLLSLVITQMDKAEARRLLVIYLGLHDLPPEELEAHLRLPRRWVGEENHAPFPRPGRRWWWRRAEATLPWRLVAALDREEIGERILVSAF